MQDIGLNTDADLGSLNGDLVVQFSDPNHMRDIIQTFPGNWKEFPTCGVGIFQYVGSNGKQATVAASVQSQAVQDGFINTNLIEATQDPNGNFNLTIPRNVVIGS